MKGVMSTASREDSQYCYFVKLFAIVGTFDQPMADSLATSVAQGGDDEKNAMK